MKRKFTLTEETLVMHENLTLYRIKALADFGNVKAGTKGGFVQSWENLSHDGLCWIADKACVYGYARVSGNALICDEAVVRRYARVYGNAIVRDNAILKGSVHVYENALVGLRSLLIDGATVNGNARVLCEQFKGSRRRPNIRGYGTVTDNAQLLERGFVRDNAILRGNVILRGNAGLSGRAVADENVILDGSAKMADETRAFGYVFLTGRTKMFGRSAAYGRCTLTGKTLILCNAHVTGSGEYRDLILSGDQYYTGRNAS